METKTSRSILERVKAAKDKQANAGPPGAPPPEISPVGLGNIAAGGIGGAMQGIGPGALLGLGYGTAKGKPLTGGVRGAGRGALTLGGGTAGMMAGVGAAQQLGGDTKQQLLGALLGAGTGAFGGWKAADKLMGKQMKEKEAGFSTGGQPIPQGENVFALGGQTGGRAVGGAAGALGGGAAGALGGLALAGQSKATGVKKKLLQALALAGGGVGGAVLGRMAGGSVGGTMGHNAGVQSAQGNWDVVPGVKQARDPSGEAFAGAIQDMAAGQLKSDAFRDVRNVGLTALGVGAAGRGLVGLIQHMKQNRAKKTRSGPAYLPLPYPAKTAAFDEAMGDIATGGVTAGAGLGAYNRLGRMAPRMGRMGLPVAIAGSMGAAMAGNAATRGALGRSQAEGGPATAKSRLDTSVGDQLAGSGAALGGTAGAFTGAAPGALLALLAGRGKFGRTGLGGLTQVLGGASAVGGGIGGAVRGSSGGSEVVRSLLGRGKEAGFLDGDSATTKGGVPWYGPAMMLGGLGGLGLGWKGMDKVLDVRRQREQENELASARQQFHDALLSQYDEPIKVHPEMLAGKKKAASDQTMVKVGEALDELYDAFQKAAADEDARPMSKQAVDWSNMAGQAAGGYGMYAGLSGLLTGALVYDKIQKRSRRAVLDKALAKRQRRKFMQQPTEIFAVPEAMPTEG